MSGENKQRLQRVMADAGVAARRTCERLIEDGHVTINDKVVTRLPVFVDPDADVIKVDGRRIERPARPIYVMLHKPTRTLVAGADEPGFDRQTVADLVDHPGAARLFPVGRLDFDCTGLVLLTNDGDLANRLTHPRYGVPKTYQALVRGDLDESALDAIRDTLRGRRSESGSQPPGPRVRARPPELRIIKHDAGRTVIEIVLYDAQNQRLQDVLKYLGMPVKKLVRTAIGPLQLRALGLGQWRELTREEVRSLKDSGVGRGDGQTSGQRTPKTMVRTGRRPPPRDRTTRKA